MNVIDRKNTSCNPSHMMALLGFANFYKVKPLLLQSSFCLVLCGSSLDNTSSTWLSGGLPIEIFNRSNPFLCSSCCVCVTERLDRRAFQFGAVARCSDAYSHVTKYFILGWLQRSVPRRGENAFNCNVQMEAQTQTVTGDAPLELVILDKRI